MNSLQDIPAVYNDSEFVHKNLQTAWPSDALVPSKGRELVAGIDALYTLYRHIYSHTPEEQ